MRTDAGIEGATDVTSIDESSDQDNALAGMVTGLGGVGAQSS